MIRGGVAVMALASASLAGCGSLPTAWIPNTSSAPRVEDLGSGVLKMTLRSGILVVGTAELKARVEQDALAYCGARTGAVAILDSVRNDPEPPGYPSASVVFRCVTP